MLYNFYMAKQKTRKELQKELTKITDTIDIDFTNEILKQGNVLENFNITKKTLQNIATWSLDGKSEFEIRQNLELTRQEWTYLCKVCPTILQVMQHSRAYAEIVIIGSIYQTAIGGHTIKKKMPIKIKDYENGRCVGEHVEIIEYEETQPSNPLLLKWLAENKLGENFGKTKVDNSQEHREIVDNLDTETLNIIESMSEKDVKES